MLDVLSPDMIYLNYGFAAAAVWFLLRQGERERTNHAKERADNNKQIVTHLNKIAIILEERIPKKEF